jgi:hypothetical protein
MTAQKIHFNEKKELKMNVKDFIYWFNYRWTERTGEPYPIKQLNWDGVGNKVKRYVLDELTERGFGVEEMKEFINWVFETKPERHWDFKKWVLVKEFFTDWIRQRAIKNVQRKVLEERTIATRRKEEEQFLKMIVEGYFDNQLPRDQVWIGMRFRQKNWPEEQRRKLELWQRKEFSRPELEKLGRWKAELEAFMPTFDAQRQFYIEMSKSKGQKLVELLHELRREKLYSRFTKEELEREEWD